MRRLSVSPRVLVALFVTLSVLLMLTGVIELRQNRQEMQRLMRDQAYTLLESLLAASDNALNAADLLRSEPGASAPSSEIGFGYLLRRVSDHPGIVYVALQDTFGIIAGSGRLDGLEPLETSAFLRSALVDPDLRPHDRVVRGDSLDVLEMVLPFYYRDNPVGLFRLGLSMAPLDAIDGRVVRRVVLLMLIILAIGFIVVTLIVSSQNEALLKRQFKAVETYSSRVIDSVNDGIVVCDSDGIIRTVNRVAGELFHVDGAAVGRPVRDILPSESAGSFLASPALIGHVECVVDGNPLHLLIARATFDDENGVPNQILVVRDLTRQRRLEQQLEQRARLSAIGQMAGGLAHEIRNPLNAVGMIVQQLGREFEKRDDSDEYRELLGVVHHEVRRINKSLKSFLQMVRPEPIRPEPFALADLFSFLRQEYASLARDQGVEMKVHAALEGDVVWDREQMQQALMNLVQNAIQAMEGGGALTLEASESTADTIAIVVSDTGAGIPAEVQNRIFDLYFTTRPGGTGIGLSLVQRIVGDHGGTVQLESPAGKGTTFILQIPRWARGARVA